MASPENHPLGIHAQRNGQHENMMPFIVYTQGDSDVISVPAGFRRHLVGKTPLNVFSLCYR